MLRTVLIGPTQWHLPLDLEPMLEVDDLEYVGVAEPDLTGFRTRARQALRDGSDGGIPPGHAMAVE